MLIPRPHLLIFASLWLLGWAQAAEPAGGAAHWAFEPLNSPSRPAITNVSWPRNEIDRFILARLEASGLCPSPEADRVTLIRRVTLDLTGLPPSPEAVDEFVQNDSPDAYEHLIDRLLASPAYGERWGRHWLDLARYADSSGYHNDLDRPYAWKYRDYVIRSFNEDKPYAQFVAEQLAGDEIDEPSEASLIATGFGRNGPSNYRFNRCGQSGIEIAETFPNLARHADDLCVIRSMQADSNNHGPALFQMNTGFIQAGRPCMGSWVTYGLGSESEDLPAFVVLLDHQGAPVNGAMNWSNGFMPAAFQGVPFRTSGEPVAYLSPPPGVSPSRQRARLDLLQKWNADFAAANPAESALAARVNAYELAFRMQMSATECTDLSREPEITRRRYGLDEKVTAHFGKSCLLARRLVERGVRFIQVYSGGNEGPKAWDAHDDLKKNHDLHCAETDGPIAALLDDLKASGLLDTTLVVWGGEFGRSPVAENGKGRDHHPKGFTMWLAGGGIRGGMIHGATDEFGYHAVEKKVTLPDLHATILHQLGLDHEELTFRHSGRDFRLTDVSGKVLRELLA